MCGIAGYNGEFGQDLLARMNAVLAHRGPDDSDHWCLPEQSIGLTHRRLSIIDLSPLGRQPMHDAAGSVAISYNGEIYNYRELRGELEAEGAVFTSQSDTEVLLQLYLRDGPEMLSRLNGIFAFGLWDRRDHSLFLARDGVGVKPLYFAETSRGFLFASELKALLEEQDLGRELNPLAIHYHLAFLWCPAPHTMLRSVEKLEPGHAMLVRDGRIRRRWRYYDLPYDQPIEPVAEEEAVRRVRAALERAVQRQMVADVPVGAFLSGGLDSSAVVALARREVAGRRLQCFTIGFRGDSFAEEGFADDLAYAERVAAELDVDLHTIHVGHEMAEELETMIYHLDEPQADPAPIHVLFISRLARQNGIKVLLSGVGGDDIFTGYRRHRALELERYWGWMPHPARAALGGAARALGAGSPAGRRIRKAFQYASLEETERIASYFLWLDPRVQRGLYGPALREPLASVSTTGPLVEAINSLPGGTDRLNRMLYLEGKFFLTDHNLNYSDKMSMAEGVEVRVPLLDPDLIALAARLPTSLKQRGTVGKYVFKKAMESELPLDVIYRPKTGFGAPLRRWLRHELSPLVSELLSERSLGERGLFDALAVRRLIEDDRAGRIDGSYTIFTLICIESWCRIFLGASRPRPVGV